MGNVVFDDPEACEAFSGAWLPDGFEDALIGLGTQGNRAVAVLSWDKCVDILVERDQMSYDEAVEFVEFNVAGAWAGENTPVFVRAFVKNVESIQ